MISSENIWLFQVNYNKYNAFYCVQLDLILQTNVNKIYNSFQNMTMQIAIHVLNLRIYFWLFQLS